MSNPEDNIENIPDADDAVENTSAEATDTVRGIFDCVVSIWDVFNIVFGITHRDFEP
jgi:hypothetical protein